MSSSWDTPNESENDEFPDLDVLVHRARKEKKSAAQQPPAKTSAARRRKLGPLADNILLKPWTEDAASPLHNDTPPPTAELLRPPRSTIRPRIQGKARKQKPISRTTAINDKKQELGIDIPTEVTHDGKESTDESCRCPDTTSLGLDGLDDWGDGPGPNHPAKSTTPSSKSWPKAFERTTTQRRAGPGNVGQHVTVHKPAKRQGEEIDLTSPSRTSLPDPDLVEAINRLIIDGLQPPTSHSPETKSGRPATPPLSITPKMRPGLVSPKKLPRIPTTPHHPSTDLFWSKDFVDDWNDEHSPKKQLFPDATRSPSKKSASPGDKGTTNKRATSRDIRKAFEKAKHDLAQKFLEELDKAITNGRLSDLAETTGGIKLIWTNKLNTTAGRANWKRETVRTRNPDGSEATVKHRHHASIELAEKVIDDEHRLLNVIAHEFCHLANFMVSGVTNNPHGKEFKAWASKCSHMFGDRGIEVTTKHTYDIDFKYIWECTSCAMEYKRHSKSINPDRHRCGSCKGGLKQTRPVPRAGGSGKVSEYQKFMKEQMKLIKEDNPKSPQKEIMKRVADRWSALQASSKSEATPQQGGPSIDQVAAGMEMLQLSCANGTEG